MRLALVIAVVWLALLALLLRINHVLAQRNRHWDATYRWHQGDD